MLNKYLVVRLHGHRACRREEAGPGMVVVMAAAAVWGVLQLFVASWPTRSLRLSTVLIAFAVGVYGCGVTTGLIEFAYTRLYAEQSGLSLVKAENVTSYMVAPWVEELVKVSPLLLAGLSIKVRRQWGLTDYVVLGGALGGGFGLLEAVLRFGLDADRAIVRDGAWVVPDSLFAPYVPSPDQVFTAWLPAPFGQLSTGAVPATETFTHLVWTSVAGMGVGVLWRTRGWVRLLAVVPLLAAAAHHTLNNYAVQEPGGRAEPWLETLDANAWAAPLVCLAVAMAVDLRQLHRGKWTVPGVLLVSERAEGDSAGALLRYAAWHVPWSLLVALRYVRLRRSLLFAAAVSETGRDTEELRAGVSWITGQMDASDYQGAWRRDTLRARLKAARARDPHRIWLLLVPCVLSLPALLFLGVGSFTSTAGLQEFFSTGTGPRILMGFCAAALLWIVWQLAVLLRTWRAVSDQVLAEPWAVHRFRIGTALGAGTTGFFLLYRGFGDAGPDGRSISSSHLLDALDTFLVSLGFALVLLSLLALFPPGGVVLAGVGTVGPASVGAVFPAALLGSAGIVLMVVGAGGNTGTPDGFSQHAWPRSKRKGPVKPRHRADVKGDEGKNGSHTIERHVEKTTRDMRSRLRNEPQLDADSRFLREADAQRFADGSLLRNQKRIDNWLQGKKSKLQLDESFNETTGLRLTRNDFKHGIAPREVRSVRVILKRDPGAPSGYRILTSYPTP
ncbi:RNase A-like domain-containing protein [Streptomyces sp. NPDC046988]|uniref:RNase A-like domain-containing protein n=1 Tax=Streptomyces sp. NPDC046988 TaxID=3154922 RepID=UPI0033F01155